MTAEPFPIVESWDELKALPEGSFVECVSCIEHLYVAGDVDPQAWAAEHARGVPTHERFRIVAMTNFRVVPTEPRPEPVTTAT
ncbi:hypothetical protein ABT124_31640 [Streptomyces sp. NPDC001982]|uniref:DUF7848 domain-containing protein n=1 Tax=Streptomyces sp. NPDC001982 TaxID=3154405 RepID=UPI003330A64D